MPALRRLPAARARGQDAGGPVPPDTFLPDWGDLGGGDDDDGEEERLGQYARERLFREFRGGAGDAGGEDDDAGRNGGLF